MIFGASNAPAALVGSIDNALYGYTPTASQGETPVGVTIGFTACPGGVGTNIFCNTNSGIVPGYMFENIGLIQASSSGQLFTQDASTAPTFNDIAVAMSAGVFNFSFAHRAETASTVGIPLDGYSYGAAGPSTNLSGYWLGSEIDYVTVTIDPFAFRLKDFGPNGGLVYEIYNPNGPGFYSTDALVNMRFEFYGTRGEYQEAPPAPISVPEPTSWMMLILGFTGLGAALRQHRSVLGAT
jgi:hypothetical protein